eukprot:GHVH01016730.1.p1 GENE.GHVH01016730.1~~GHVH01016730.1.p1  ORF type:complete len:593 (+),score=78.34 GHVH01016730.1:2552-4330(+)
MNRNLHLETVVCANRSRVFIPVIVPGLTKMPKNTPEATLSSVARWRCRSGAINGYFKSHRSFCAMEGKRLRGTGKKKVSHYPQKDYHVELLAIEQAWAAGISMKWEIMNATAIKKVSTGGKLRQNARHRFKRVIKNLESATQLPVTLSRDQNKHVNVPSNDYSWPIYRSYMLATAKENYGGVDVVPDPLPDARAGLSLALVHLAARGSQGFFTPNPVISMDHCPEVKGLMMVISDLGRILMDRELPDISRLTNSKLIPSEVADCRQIELPKPSFLVKLLTSNEPRTTDDVIKTVFNSVSYWTVFDDWPKPNKGYHHYRTHLTKTKEDVFMRAEGLRRDDVDMAVSIRNDVLALWFRELEIDVDDLLFSALVIISFGGCETRKGYDRCRLDSVCRTPSQWKVRCSEVMDRVNTIITLAATEDESSDDDNLSISLNEDVLLSIIGRKQVFEYVSRLRDSMVLLTDIASVITQLDKNEVDASQVEAPSTPFGKVVFSLESCTSEVDVEPESTFEARRVFFKKLFAAILKKMDENEKSKLIDNKTSTASNAVHSPETHEAGEDTREEEMDDIFDPSKRTDEMPKSMFSSLKQAFWG